MDKACNYGKLEVGGLKPMLSIDILNKMDVFISVEKMAYPCFYSFKSRLPEIHSWVLRFLL